MKIASLVARYLLGLLFLVFGLNGFLHFIPAPLPPGIAGQFLLAMAASHYMVVVSGFQVIGGVLLLLNRYVPLGLTILAAELVNILSFHIFMAPSGLPIAVVSAILWVLVFVQFRSAFGGLFQPRA